MPDTFIKVPDEQSNLVSMVQWFFGYVLPGIGLLALGFISAMLAPANAIGLGGFLCFFTLGVSLIVEGTKRVIVSRRLQRAKKKE